MRGPKRLVAEGAELRPVRKGCREERYDFAGEGTKAFLTGSAGWLTL
ncbi:hypothetical protein [Thermodesulfitimonas autotrophica]